MPALQNFRMCQEPAEKSPGRSPSPLTRKSRFAVRVITRAYISHLNKLESKIYAI